MTKGSAAYPPATSFSEFCWPIFRALSFSPYFSCHNRPFGRDKPGEKGLVDYGGLNPVKPICDKNLNWVMSAVTLGSCDSAPFDRHTLIAGISKSRYLFFGEVLEIVAIEAWVCQFFSSNPSR
jgi:hypothetical protein